MLEDILVWVGATALALGVGVAFGCGVFTAIDFLMD